MSKNYHSHINCFFTLSTIFFCLNKQRTQETSFQSTSLILNALPLTVKSLKCICTEDVKNTFANFPFLPNGKCPTICAIFFYCYSVIVHLILWLHFSNQLFRFGRIQYILVSIIPFDVSMLIFWGKHMMFLHMIHKGHIVQ